MKIICFAAIVFLATQSMTNAQQCSQCSQISSDGTYSCQSLSPDQRANCETRAQEAAARCYRSCTNYNGIGPSGNPRGSATR
jgi:hypothetical protein